MEQKENKFIIVNHIKKIMVEKDITPYKLSRITNIPRQTITRIIENKYSNPEIYTLSAIAQSLSVQTDSLFEMKINPRFLFTKQNLNIINELNEHLKIKFNFLIYNNVENMNIGKNLNIYTNYSTQRRLYFSGNFAIIPKDNELLLRDFDLIENRANISDDEKFNLYYGILNSMKYFGSHILNVHKIKLHMGFVHINLQDCNTNTSPNVISTMLNDSNKESHNLIIYFRAAFLCGFRISPESIIYRNGFRDFWMQKNV